MSYSTLTALQDRLGTLLYARLTDRASGTTPNATVAQQLLDEADAEINSYLARRYATPVDLVGHPELQEILEARVLDVAEYRAWNGSPFVNDIPARVKSVYARVLEWLRAVGSGVVELPAALSANETLRTQEAPLASGSPRAFTHEELDGL